MSDVKDHVVWHTHNFNGDCVIFWGPDESGYVTDLNKAGRYTKEHAERIEKRRGQEKAVPLAVAEACIVNHVHATKLREALVDLAAKSGN
jgi:hypothetical protein